MVIAICSLWKLYKCLLRQIAKEFMLFLVNNLMKKKTQKVKTNEILKTCAHSLYLALMLHKNALVLSQSEARNFSLRYLHKKMKMYPVYS